MRHRLFVRTWKLLVYINIYIYVLYVYCIYIYIPGPKKGIDPLLNHLRVYPNQYFGDSHRPNSPKISPSPKRKGGSSFWGLLTWGIYDYTPSDHPSFVADFPSTIQLLGNPPDGSPHVLAPWPSHVSSRMLFTSRPAILGHSSMISFPPLCYSTTGTCPFL